MMKYPLCKYLLHIAVINGHWCGLKRPQRVPNGRSIALSSLWSRSMHRSACKPLIPKVFSCQWGVITPVKTFTIDTKIPLEYCRPLDRRVAAGHRTNGRWPPQNAYLPCGSSFAL